MKHTKNMIINPTAESEELTLYANNTGELYRLYTLPVIDNLARKMSRGTYDDKKAIDAFYHVAQEAARMCVREFSSVSPEGNTVFDVTARYTAASGILEHNREHIEERAEEIRATKKGGAAR